MPGPEWNPKRTRNGARPEGEHQGGVERGGVDFPDLQYFLRRPPDLCTLPVHLLLHSVRLFYFYCMVGMVAWGGFPHQLVTTRFAITFAHLCTSTAFFAWLERWFGEAFRTSW